jgi:glycerol kinase
MEADFGKKGKELRVDGGAVANNLLMQFQSDLFGFNVIRPKTLETTALGAAYLAGLAVGYWKSVDDLQQQWSIDRIFSAEMPEIEVNKLVKNWDKAVGRASNWIED